jgi:hypothetical protein
LREWLGQVLNTQSGAVDGEVMICRDRVILTVLEGPVLDELSVDSSITRVVDVLSTSSVIECYLVALLIRLLPREEIRNRKVDRNARMSFHQKS